MGQLYNDEGVKRKDAYILMDKHIFDGYCLTFASLYIYYITWLTLCIFRKEVQLNCADGSLGVFIWGDLPTEMCSSLERNIRTALIVEGTSPIVKADSAISPDGHTFPAIHFDYYARNGTLVSLFLIYIQHLLDILIRGMVHHKMCIHLSLDAQKHLVPTIINLFLESLRS
jgi:hypothetical protein